jgi:hypothetical protein
MRAVFTYFILMIAAMGASSFASGPSSEMKKVVHGPGGYSEAWVKIANLEVSLPFCNRKSIQKLDEYCLAPDGTISRVTAIRGKTVSYEKIDISTAKQYAGFASAIAPTGSSRMPASAPEVEVSCEASCPQLDFANKCVGKGANQRKAFRDLSENLNSQKDADCKNCNLSFVTCNGVLLKNGRAPASK